MAYKVLVTRTVPRQTGPAAQPQRNQAYHTDKCAPTGVVTNYYYYQIDRQSERQIDGQRTSFLIILLSLLLLLLMLLLHILLMLLLPSLFQIQQQQQLQLVSKDAQFRVNVKMKYYSDIIVLLRSRNDIQVAQRWQEDRACHITCASISASPVKTRPSTRFKSIAPTMQDSPKLDFVSKLSCKGESK